MSDKDEYEYVVNKLNENELVDWINKHEPWRLSKKTNKLVEKNTENKEIDWFNELEEINGIGNETAKDIIKIYPTKDDLIKSLKSEEHIPLVNKYVKILKKIFN